MGSTLGTDTEERVLVGGAGTRFQVDLEDDPATGQPRSSIGAGGFGVVCRATWDGGEVAAKTLHMFRNPQMYGLDENPSALAQVVREFEEEISLNRRLEHENIIGFVGVAYKSFMGHEIPAWLCMELAPTDLKAAIDGPSGVPQELVPTYTRDAAKGLQYMHAQKVLHRDVKPANMLLARDGCLKLCDFGMSIPVEDVSELTEARAGTPIYLPPEPYDHDKKDVFGLGCTLVEMILKEAPDGTGTTAADRRPDQARRAAEQRADLALVVKGCTASDHKQRFRAVDVLACEELLA